MALGSILGSIAQIAGFGNAMGMFGSAPSATSDMKKEDMIRNFAYQTHTNAASKVLNQQDSVNPFGSTKYVYVGNQELPGPRGTSIIVPKYEKRSVYTPAEQKVFDQNQKVRQGMALNAARKMPMLLGMLDQRFVPPSVNNNRITTPT